MNAFNMIRNNRRQQFQRGRNVLVTCRMCGKKTHSNLDGCEGLDLCRPCREKCEMENEHFDGHHEATPNMNCPLCKTSPAKEACNCDACKHGDGH